ncbi:hypothetical protein DFJ74DRAFT_663922 [Hyaloraphidium curvatum]|nr:hypothetical protein DFJ74DRAFT_663922 [Hyaloraphidium curvatum]
MTIRGLLSGLISSPDIPDELALTFTGFLNTVENDVRGFLAAKSAHDTLLDASTMKDPEMDWIQQFGKHELPKASDIIVPDEIGGVELNDHAKEQYRRLVEAGKLDQIRTQNCKGCGQPLDFRYGNTTWHTLKASKAVYRDVHTMDECKALAKAGKAQKKQEEEAALALVPDEIGGVFLTTMGKENYLKLHRGTPNPLDIEEPSKRICNAEDCKRNMDWRIDGPVEKRGGKWEYLYTHNGKCMKKVRAKAAVNDRDGKRAADSKTPTEKAPKKAKTGGK